MYTHRGALAAAVLATAMLLGACGAGSTATTTITTHGQATATTHTEPPTATAMVQAGVGDTITVDQVATTLVSVTKLTPSQYDSVKAGDIYVVCHVKIVNHNTSDEPYNEYDFQVLSGAGNLTNTTIAIAYTANDELNSGTLAPGGTVEGDLIFEVAANDHAAKLTWQPSFLGQQEDNAWVLGL